MRRLSDRAARSLSKGIFFLRRVQVHSLLVVLVVAVGVCPQTLSGQYRKLSVIASVGYSSLNLSSVDSKNQSDVDGWAAQGIPVSQFSSLKQSPFYKAGVSYRLEREFGFSLTWSYWRKSVSASYNGTDASLLLKRGVGSTDYVLGISFYPDVQFSFLQWYFQANLDLECARATASAAGIQNFSIEGEFRPTPFVETEALYKKTKTALGITLGADMRIIRNVFLNAEASYRFAQLGTMEGNISQLGVSGADESTTIFDFSGILLSTGLRFEL